MAVQPDSTRPATVSPAARESAQPEGDGLRPDAPEGAVAVRVRYFAGARAAAGVAEETLQVTSAAPGPVRAGDVLDAALSAHGERLAGVVAACSFLLNGVSMRDRAAEVATGDELDVLPPFAGG